MTDTISLSDIITVSLTSQNGITMSGLNTSAPVTITFPSLPLSSFNCQSKSGPALSCNPICVLWQWTSSVWTQAGVSTVGVVLNTTSGRTTVVCSIALSTVSTVGVFHVPPATYVTVSATATATTTATASATGTAPAVTATAAGTSTGTGTVVPAEDAVSVTIKLGILIENVTASYKTQFVADVATSIGVSADRIQILLVIPGSIYITFEILPANRSSSATPGVSVSAALSSFITQFSNPNSPLRTASTTSSIIVSSQPNVTTLSPCFDGSFAVICSTPAPTTVVTPAVTESPSSDNTKIIIIVVPVIVGGLLVIGVAAFALYRRSGSAATKSPVGTFGGGPQGQPRGSDVELASRNPIYEPHHHQQHGHHHHHGHQIQQGADITIGGVAAAAAASAGTASNDNGVGIADTETRGGPDMAPHPHATPPSSPGRKAAQSRPTTTSSVALAFPTSPPPTSGRTHSPTGAGSLSPRRIADSQNAPSGSLSPPRPSGSLPALVTLPRASQLSFKFTKPLPQIASTDATAPIAIAAATASTTETAASSGVTVTLDALQLAPGSPTGHASSITRLSTSDLLAAAHVAAAKMKIGGEPSASTK